MAIRPKTKRRVSILIGGFTLVVLLIAGLWVYREKQARHLLSQQRVDGMTAFKNGDWSTAVAQLSLYVNRRSDDGEALYALAKAEMQDPDPGEDHLSDAANYLHRYLDLYPDNMDATHELLTLEFELYSWDQVIDLSSDILKQDDKDPQALNSLATALVATGNN